MSRSPGLCPHCGAVLEVIFLAPGDKAARCRYCDVVIELPGGERTRIGAAPSVDLVDQVDQMLAQVQQQALQASEHAVKHVRHERVDYSSRTTAEGDMPDGVEDMLAGMGITFGPTEPAVAAKDVVVSWPDGREYQGKLMEQRDQQALVEFADGSRRWVPLGSLRPR